MRSHAAQARARLANACAVLTLGLVAPARADEGFALDRFEPSERGSDWLVLDSLDLRSGSRPAAGVVLDYAKSPLVVVEGERVVDEIVAHQLFAHVGGAWIFGDRFRAGASFPLALVNDGGSGQARATTVAFEGGASAGDLRLAGAARLFGSYGKGVTGAVTLRLHLPTGSRVSFSGDGQARLASGVALAGDAGALAWAASAGFLGRGLSSEIAGEPVGSELEFAFGAGVRAMERRLLVGPELAGATRVSGGLFGATTTPLELLLGAHYRVAPTWRVSLGAGPGISNAIGTPELRAVASLTWVTEPAKEAAPPSEPATPKKVDEVVRPPILETKASPPRDRDADGVADETDVCPDIPGERDRLPDPKRDGCPPDRDGDEIPDSSDVCPDEPGVAGADAARRGCPKRVDTDGDGIFDEVDACPRHMGPANDNRRKAGCPQAALDGDRVRIRDSVEFNPNGAVIRAESEPLLDAILAVLVEHADIDKIVVEGHTDDRGNRAFNKRLSRDRAVAVVEWLVGHGISRRKLRAEGFGADRPVEPNDTDEGRQNNRRVEIRVVRPGATAPDPTAPTP